MEGPPLVPGGEDITWADQVAPRGRKASSTRKIKPQTSNLTSSKAVVAEAPAATTHISLAKAAAIFGEIEKIIPLNFSSMSIGPSLHYEITHTNANSPIIANGQEVTGINFLKVKTSISKKNNL